MGMGIIRNLLDRFDPKKKLDREIAKVEEKIKLVSEISPSLRRREYADSLIGRLSALRKKRERT